MKLVLTVNGSACTKIAVLNMQFHVKKIPSFAVKAVNCKLTECMHPHERRAHSSH